MVCPAAQRELMFQMNQEIDPNNAHGSFLYPYAAFYLTSGTCRSPCQIKKQRTGTSQGQRGASPPIGDPSSVVAAQPWDNAQRGVPSAYLTAYDPAAKFDENKSTGLEPQCFLQAVDPSQIDNPGRVFYLGYGREYRPEPGQHPPATFFNSWMSGYGNKIFLGTRHSGFANMVYMDGHCNSDNQMHDPRWNLAYTGDPKDIRNDKWRVASFADDIRFANVRTQSHQMPQLMVRGWEWFFKWMDLCRAWWPRPNARGSVVHRVLI